MAASWRPRSTTAGPAAPGRRGRGAGGGGGGGGGGAPPGRGGGGRRGGGGGAARGGGEGGGGAAAAIEHFLCTDAVPESSFLCRRYLAARGIEDRAEAVALDRIDARLAEVAVDLAVNIHSFSECRPQAIDWWLALLARHRVRWLMVAPNAMDHGGARLLTNAGVDFAPLIARHGYRLRWRAPKFVDSLVQRYGLSPTMYHFFELG